MPNKAKFSERLQEALRLRRILKSVLAERVGVQLSTVSRWFSGAEPHYSTLEKIAEALGVDAKWLQGGEGQMLSDANRSFAEEPLPYRAGVSQERIAVRWVPLISWVHAGEAASYEELPLDSQIQLPVPDFQGRAFALRVQGDSMEPRCLNGDCVLVTPDREPQTGNLVVAKLKTDGVLLRRFTSTVGGRIRLTAYNPLYGSTEHSPDDFHWIYPVQSTIRTE